MASIEPTAYPRFKRLITAHELRLFFSPARDEPEWAAGATDGDEHLLAPAFRQEGRTELHLSHVSSLTGLRHLTMLTTLSLDWCQKATDFTEVGEPTGLTDLSITGHEGIEDLTPIGRLAQLTRLSLSGCRAVEDTEPLLNLSRLRELNLFDANVRSAHGFSQAFPVLESMNLRYCQSFNGTWCFTTSGTPAPIGAELRDRGVTVALRHRLRTTRCAQPCTAPLLPGRSRPQETLMTDEIPDEPNRLDQFRGKALAHGIPSDDVERWLDTARPCAILELKPGDGPVVGRLRGGGRLPWCG
ncbi:hypothetical protein ACIF80_24145 [Streptomyces sp. NPDC085927]|uniref:hypothetical protein n=1 Tax=Streptomyces sp. NPDC085927 TaxID=3365738 RepID=UPI0037D779AB